MRIILNSDVLHSKLNTRLAKHIEDFCRKAAQYDAILALPRTVTLEIQRNQQKFLDETIAELEKANSLLTEWGVTVPPFDPHERVQRVDLLSALRATSIKVEEHDPTLEDYREAERRACLHLAPQAPESKSDEMRDLIIWVVALRLAKRDGGAILVSRDDVHSHERGGDEAAVCRLHRAKTFDEALTQLGVSSPANELAKSVLLVVWNELRSAGLPFPKEIPDKQFFELSFIADEEGHPNARFRFELETEDGLLSGGPISFKRVQR